MKKLKVGTRGSRLALCQCGLYLERLKKERPDLDFEIITIRTSGDQFGQMAPEEILKASGKGIFVKEIEEAILEGRIDFAVHSLKDVPAAFDRRLVLGGYQERDDPRDALVSLEKRRLNQLPEGARVGTSSFRRKTQLLEMARSLGKKIEVLPLRGNVETRLSKVRYGELDGAVMSAAGLLRLGLADAVGHFFDPIQEMTPACGQGTLAAQALAERSDIINMLAAAEEPSVRLASELERKVLAVMGGGCLDALGIYAKPHDEPGALELCVYRHDSDLPDEKGWRECWKIRAAGLSDFLSRLAAYKK